MEKGLRFHEVILTVAISAILQVKYTVELAC